MTSNKQASLNIRLLTGAVGLFCVFAFSGCSVGEYRAHTLQKFSSNVAMHLLDRNPDTINESMTHLFREELTEPVIAKLQKSNQLPKTELSILKIVDEDQELHESNKVKVEKVQALGPIEKELVPFQVSGIIITEAKGKPDTTQPFLIKMNIKMGSDTSDNPQVVDITEGMPQLKKSKLHKHH